jgi:hypothetical protein
MKSINYVSQIEPHYLTSMSRIGLREQFRSTYSVDWALTVCVPVISGIPPYCLNVVEWELRTFKLNHRLDKSKLDGVASLFQYVSWDFASEPTLSAVEKLYFWRFKGEVYHQRVKYKLLINNERVCGLPPVIPQWHIDLVGDLSAAKR